MSTETVVAEVAGENCLVVRVRELRGARTLSEVAARVGMRQDDLGRIERGETSSIRYDTLLKLCTEFKVGPNEIFTVEPLTKSTPTPLERVLAAIEAGTVRTHRIPTSRGSHVLRQEESFDLADAFNFVDLEEPVTPRRRVRPLSARVK